MSLSCVEFTGAIATSLLLLISAASVGRACVCQPESPELAYCRADWGMFFCGSSAESLQIEPLKLKTKTQKI
jgi:hypothetical protein